MTTSRAMPGEAYPHLFAPLVLGPRTARNRIVFGAHFTMFTEPAPRYGRARVLRRAARPLPRASARAAAPASSSPGRRRCTRPPRTRCRTTPSAWDEAAVPHFGARDARRCTRTARWRFLQLAHNGGVNTGRWSKLPVWAPSQWRTTSRRRSRSKRHEIRELVDHFARSARERRRGRLRRHRDPRRARLPDPRVPLAASQPPHRRVRRHAREPACASCVEVLEAVRAAVGAGVAVGLRLVGDEEIGPARPRRPTTRPRSVRGSRRAGLVDFLERQHRPVGRRHGAAALRAARAAACTRRRAVKQRGARARRCSPCTASSTPDEAEGDPRPRRRRRGDARARADRRPGVGGQGARRRAPTRSAAAPASTRAATAT